MKKIIKITQQTSNKHVNLFEIIYQTEKGEYRYEIASRRKRSELYLYHKSTVSDAVRILPYIKKGNELYVILIKEYRYAVNRYLYELPAGLVDMGETEEQAASRELKEEIGANVISLQQTEKSSFISVGMSDENLVCFEAEVTLSGEQKLDENEDISLKIVKIDQLPKLLQEQEFDLQSRLQLKTFYYKQKLSEHNIEAQL